MSSVRGRWQQGSVILDEPVQWPEGCPLVIAEANREFSGMTEAEQSNDPLEIERWIADMEAIPSLELTPQEEADLFATLNWAKDFNIEAVRQQMQRAQP